VDDSKKLSAKKREALSDEIKKTALCWGIGRLEPGEIDEINILQATFRAMRLALEALTAAPEVILADGPNIPGLIAGIPQKNIVRGDSQSQSVAAASIIAKVERDALMREFHRLYPEYGFDANKGYGSAKHIEAIHAHGLCPIHRRSFVKRIINGCLRC